jgi:16S rRNA (guanine527-N7)-methyltransferase
VKESVDPSTLLRRGIEQLGIPDPDRAAALLGRYLDEIDRWNPRFGLVRHDGREDLVVRHVLDSLAAWPMVREAAGTGGAVLDVGSGAGFPGLPLAVALPECSFTLLERMARRASFLKTCALLLGLSRVRVVQGDLAEQAGEWDVVTFRAVAPLPKFLEDVRRSRVTWRSIIAYKGRKARTLEEIGDVRRSAARGIVVDLRPLRIPFLDEERCLAVITHGSGAELY